LKCAPKQPQLIATSQASKPSSQKSNEIDIPRRCEKKGCLPKWHRLKLDHDIARRHGLGFDRVVITEDATDLI
jgi:hypothetical protein